MGKVLECIGDNEKEFISKQKVFFVATAPLSNDFYVNVSPKAPGTSVVVINSYTVAYADLTGSGNETASHIIENGRMTLLFVNLEEGLPKILRLYGKAKVVLADDVNQHLLNQFPSSITKSYGFRCIYILNVERVSTSCGYSMPVYTKFVKYRSTLEDFTRNKGKDGMIEYRQYKNSFSINGLPGYSTLKEEEQMKGGGGSCSCSCNIRIPKLQDGYYFSEESAVVSPDDPKAIKELERRSKLKQDVSSQRNTSTISSTTMMNNMVPFITTFLVGMVSGYILSSSSSSFTARPRRS